MESLTEGWEREFRWWVRWLAVAGGAMVAFGVFSVGVVLFLPLMRDDPAPKEEVVQAEVSSSFPAVARRYLDIYQEAGKKYGVPWEVLAAIHKVETDFGRNTRESTAGAEGPMQFMDKTWVGWKYPGGTAKGDLPDSVDLTDPKVIQQYGGYGTDGDGDGIADPMNPVDAIHSAARYLAANKKPGVDWFAPNGPIYQYNHSMGYVQRVKQYAEQFATLPANALPSGWVFPVDGGKITSPYGMRKHPITGRWRMHEGVDIGKSLGAPIRAVADGVVTESRPAGGYGWIIVIDHGGYETAYAHMYERDVLVKAGDRVTKGQVIARIGNNGTSTGPHLHLEVRKNGVPVDPMPFLKR